MAKIFHEHSDSLVPSVFLKLNRHKIPYMTLYANFLVGALSFLPFPGWQKMVAFLASASIFSYGVGPICLLALRKLQSEKSRPFRLQGSSIICHIAFYICNLMLYWCGFPVMWKLYLAIVVGLVIYLSYHQRNSHFSNQRGLYWFFSYISFLLVFSYLGSFGGLGIFKFPFDTLFIFPFSYLMLYLSQRCLVSDKAEQESFVLMNKQL